jgi:hypothetical protein
VGSSSRLLQETERDKVSRQSLNIYSLPSLVEGNKMENKVNIKGLTGEFDLVLYDKTGKVKERKHVKNITVTTGFQAVSDMMGKASAQPVGFTYCGIGTGTIAPAIGDTNLGTPATCLAGGYTSSSATVWTNTTTFGAGVGTGSITEAGMFSSTWTTGVGTTMLCRQTFGVVTKGAADTLVVTWQYTLS